MNCPLRRIAGTFSECEKDECAWWCKWANRCAMVTIAGEISDRMYELYNAIEEEN